MPRTKNEIPADYKIIDVLAKNKEYEQYLLPKATGLSYRTILRILEHLDTKYLGFVTFRTEPSKKGGKEKKIYSITLKGIWAYLARYDTIIKLNSPEGKKELKRIIELFPDFLLFFKKAALFAKHGVLDIFINQFILALHHSWRTYYNMEKTFHKIKEPVKFLDTMNSLDNFVFKNIDVETLLVPLLKNRELLAPIYLSDPELSKVICEHISEAEKELLQLQERIQALKNIMFNVNGGVALSVKDRV